MNLDKKTFLAAGLALNIGAIGACSGSVVDETGEISNVGPENDGGIDASNDAPNKCPSPPSSSPLDISREETAKLVISTAALTIDTSGMQFQDVPASDPDYPYVMTAANDNIMDGYKNSDGSFNGCWGSLDPVTREQMAKIVVEAFSFAIDVQGGPHFPDVAPDRWSYPYIETLFTYSVVTGDPDGLFRPMQNVQTNEANTEVMNALHPKKK